MLICSKETFCILHCALGIKHMMTTCGFVPFTHWASPLANDMRVVWLEEIFSFVLHFDTIMDRGDNFHILCLIYKYNDIHDQHIFQNDDIG